MASRVSRAVRALREAGFDWRQYIVYIGFVAIFLFFAVTLFDQGFLTQRNLLNIIRQTATISVMAVAVTFVLSAGQIDLSTGAVAGLSAVGTAMAISSWGVVPGILVGLAIGLGVGTLNGWITTVIGIPSFLVTLAMMGVARGAAWWVSNAAPIPIRTDTFNFWFGSGDLGPVPILVVWTVAAAAVGHVIFTRTSFGRKVLATGGNPTAATYTGVNVNSIRRRVLMLSGLSAGVAGMLYAGRLQSGRFQFGEGDELSVIAAVVLGGTSLFGGVGTVIGAVFGSLMIGLINNGLVLLGLEHSQLLIARGVIIILAVALSRRE